VPDLIPTRRYRLASASFSVLFAGGCWWAAYVLSGSERFLVLVSAAFFTACAIIVLRDLVRPRAVLRLGPDGFTTPRIGLVSWSAVRGLAMSRQFSHRSILISLDQPVRQGYVPKIFSQLPRDVIWVPVDGLPVDLRALGLELQRRAEQARQGHVPINQASFDDAAIPRLRTWWALRRSGPRAAIHEYLCRDSNQWPYGRRGTTIALALIIGVGILALLPGDLARQEDEVGLIVVVGVAFAAAFVAPALYGHVLNEPWRHLRPAEPPWPACSCGLASDVLESAQGQAADVAQLTETGRSPKRQ
jgi:hypothetical protein